MESKRGGGGYIRVVKIELTDGVADILRNVGKSLTQDEAYGYLLRLFDEGLLDERSFKMMQFRLVQGYPGLRFAPQGLAEGKDIQGAAACVFFSG